MLARALACLLAGVCVIRTVAQDAWQAQASGTNSTLRGVTYGIDQFVAVGDNGIIITSPDGVVWSHRASGTDKSLRAVAWGADSFIAVGDGGIVLQSPDAVMWFPIAVANSASDWRLNGVAFYKRSGFGDQFFGVGEDGLIVSNSAFTGMWSGKKESAARWALRGVLVEGDVTSVVGQQGWLSIKSLLYDLDGGVRDLRTIGELNAITQGPDRIVAVGRRGSVWSKGDVLAAWIQMTNAASDDLFGVAFFDGYFVAVGAGGAILQTRDLGAGWSVVPSPSTENLQAVAAGADAVVAVGARGTILRSALPVTGAPVVLESPAAAASRVGGMAGFAVKAGGGRPLRYQWLRDGQIIAGETTHVLVVPVVSVLDAGLYSVRLENEFGRVTSPAAPLTVGPAPTTPIVDTSFRADARLDAGLADWDLQPEATTGITPLRDGRVIIALSQRGRSRLVRLQADGQIDPLFLARAASPVNLHGVQPDGRLLVSGQLTASVDSSTGFFRVLDDGTVDSSFRPLVGEDAIQQALIQPDGKILLSSSSGRVVRLLFNGDMDPGFQPFSVRTSFGNISLALAPDGKIYRAVPSDGLRRFLSDGRPDTSFVSPLVSAEVGSKAFQLLTGSDGRIIVDHQTWNGRGGTSISWVAGSLQILPNGLSRSGPSERWSSALAPDGTLLSTYSGPFGNPLPEPPHLASWSSYGAAPLPMNWGVAPPLASYVAAFGPNNELWLGGRFSFYNGVWSPRIVRLNRVTTEVTAPPTLLGTWAESATVPYGRTVTIRAAANSDGPVTYEWNLNGDSEWVSSYSIRRTISPTLSFQASSPGPQRWAVRARNSAGSSVVAKGSFTVVPPFTAALSPQRVSAHSGREASLLVTIPSGAAVVHGTWHRNGVPLPSANVQADYSYLLRSVSPGDAGVYSATLTRSTGGTMEVGPIVVAVDDTSRITNFSVRTWVGVGEQSTIAGFTIPPGSARHLLVRGIGPALDAFGVPGRLANPRIELFASFGSLASNDDWGDFSVPSAPARGAPGAFPLPARSLDAALSRGGLRPGGYTVQLAGSQNTAGTGLLELYEADNLSDRITNFSARAFVRPNENIIAGFALRGSVAQRVLIRVAGPAMLAFGVTAALPNPRLELRDESGRLVAANDDWQSQTAAASVAAGAAGVGAFSFAGGSKDSALLVTLPPANYSAIVTGTGAESGVVLVEIYEVQGRE